MKRFGKKLVALVLALACVLPFGLTANAAEINVTRDGEPVTYLELGSGERANLIFDYEQWLGGADCGVNLEYISNDGGKIVTASNQHGLERGIMPMIVQPVTPGHVILKVTVIASDGKRAEISIPITIRGEVDNYDGNLINPFDDIDIEKVENPFSNVSENDWYYETTMLMYAAGYMHGRDISPKQDGSQVIYMVRNAIYASEEDVEMEVLTSEEWIQCSGLRRTSNAEGAQLMRLGTMGANLHLLSGNTVSMYQGGAQRRTMVQSLSMSCGVTGSYASSPFTDVPLTMPQATAIIWAANKKIVEGFGNGKFMPYSSITREQMCTILLRTAQRYGKTLPQLNPGVNFVDSGSIQGWAKTAVDACAKAGIIKGYEDGTFGPQKGITTQEVDAMLVRFITAVGGV